MNKILRYFKIKKMMKKLGFDYKKVPFDNRKWFIKMNDKKKALAISFQQIENFLKTDELTEKNLKEFVNFKMGAMKK